MNDMFIYQIKNKINGKSYIGQTIKDPQERWKKHISISKKEGHKDTSYIHKALRKDGVENFEFKVIDNATNRDELDRKEQLHIKELNTLVPNGYNISSGGQFAKEIDELTRKKISDSKKGERNPNWHKVFTDEEREAHRQMMIKRYSDPMEIEKQRKRSKEMWKRPEYREKMIKIIRGNVTEDFKDKVRKASLKMWEDKDFKKKMSEKKKKIWKDPEFRKKWMLARHKKIID